MNLIWPWRSVEIIKGNINFFHYSSLVYIVAGWKQVSWITQMRPRSRLGWARGRDVNGSLYQKNQNEDPDSHWADSILIFFSRFQIHLFWLSFTRRGREGLQEYFSLHDIDVSCWKRTSCSVSRLSEFVRISGAFGQLEFDLGTHCCPEEHFDRNSSIFQWQRKVWNLLGHKPLTKKYFWKYKLTWDCVASCHC